MTNATPAKELAASTVKNLAAQSPIADMGGLTQDDLALPKWQLVQAKSKLSEQGHKPGSLYNNLTNKSVDSLEFIPLGLPTKYTDLLKKEMGKMVFNGRIFDQADARLIGLDYFGNRAEDRKANAVRAYAYSGVSNGMPCIVTFKKTSYDAGKSLNSMILFSGKPAHAHKYRISSTEATSKAGEGYYVLRVEPVGETTPEEQAAALKWAGKVAAQGAETVVGASDEEVPF
jgi:hypothetical protein